MIPGAGGAAAAGLLLMVLAALLGVFLLAWWGWRVWMQRRGTPRPPLRAWQWVVAAVMSVLPIFTALMLLQYEVSNYLQDRQAVERDQQRFFTLQQSVPWGEVVLPAGSHVQRELLDGEEQLRGDVSDLRTLTDIRFAQTAALGEWSVNAMSVNGPNMLLELARPYRFAGQDCPAGYVLQFKALKEPLTLSEVPFPIYEVKPLRMADWVMNSCFESGTINVRYWKKGELIWAEVPEYELPQ